MALSGPGSKAAAVQREVEKLKPALVYTLQTLLQVVSWPTLEIWRLTRC
jgi:hypothetical protein